VSVYELFERPSGTYYLHIFYPYLHTKFGDCHFSHYGDMIVGVKIENGSCDPESRDVKNVFLHEKYLTKYFSIFQTT